MLGKAFAAVFVAAFITVAPVAAHAGPVSADDVTYTPTQSSDPSLDGSLVASECVGDVPWIDYSVVLSDPENLVTATDVTLVLSGGGNTTEIPLLPLGSGDTSSGRVLWPGASVDASGNPTGWPGWAFVNGEWVETDGNFAWTRGPITAVIRVNPEVTVPLSYPPSTAACASPENPSDPGGLAVTGNRFDPAPLLVAGGGLVLFGGLAVALVARRAARRH